MLTQETLDKMRTMKMADMAEAFTQQLGSSVGLFVDAETVHAHLERRYFVIDKCRGHRRSNRREACCVARAAPLFDEADRARQHHKPFVCL